MWAIYSIEHVTLLLSLNTCKRNTKLITEAELENLLIVPVIDL